MRGQHDEIYANGKKKGTFTDIYKALKVAVQETTRNTGLKSENL